LEKVLLAISGISPRLKAFQYTAELCSRIKADLNILQVVRLAKPKEGLKRIRDKADQLRRRIEDSMTAAAFAEAGEHEIARDILDQARRNLEPLLGKANEAGLTYQVTLKTGDPGEEIVRYLKGHRDIVLTVCDIVTGKDTASEIESASIPTEIAEHSTVPVVLIR
jgi:nucleotide-binding universal stress UspA family protein